MALLFLPRFTAPGAVEFTKIPPLTCNESLFPLRLMTFWPVPSRNSGRTGKVGPWLCAVDTRGTATSLYWKAVADCVTDSERSEIPAAGTQSVAHAPALQLAQAIVGVRVIPPTVTLVIDPLLQEFRTSWYVAGDPDVAVTYEMTVWASEEVRLSTKLPEPHTGGRLAGDWDVVTLDALWTSRTYRADVNWESDESLRRLDTVLCSWRTEIMARVMDPMTMGTMTITRRTSTRENPSSPAIRRRAAARARVTRLQLTANPSVEVDEHAGGGIGRDFLDPSRPV
jgi:hypothetical protein